MFTNSPNMNLPIPTVGNETGPNYAFDVNSALTILDQHNHAPGSGVQITPAGMNINTALNFNGNSATTLLSTVYQAQASLATLQALYVSGVDLYYNDGSGNVIQLTASGSPAGGAGSITGLPSGTAGVAFSGGVFTFSASTNTPANIQVGSVLLGNNTALSKYLTLSPPTAMAANIAQKLPTIPGSTSFMTMDSSGNMATSIASPLTGSNIASATITASNITSQTITQGLLALRAVGTTVAAGGVAISSASGFFSTTSSSFTQVTNLSVTITTTGRPVMLMLAPATSASVNSYIELTNPSGGSGANLSYTGVIGFFNGSTQMAANVWEHLESTYTSNGNAYIFPVSMSYIDTPTAGTYTYHVKAYVPGTNGTPAITINNAALVAYEL